MTSDHVCKYPIAVFVDIKRLSCSSIHAVSFRVCKLVITAALLHLLALHASAQKTFISKAITVNNGLPQGFVSGIVQDDDGFIWLGTRDGLARYDGREFKVFYFSDKRATNISSNIITFLYRDSKNRIWILHESKVIDVFDPREERFETFTNDPVYQSINKQFSPNFISVDSQNNVWLIDPGNGLWKISLNKHTVEHVSKRDHGLLCDTVRGVIEAPDKHYWVVMQRGLQQIDQQNKIVNTVRFDFPASKDINVNRNFAAGLTMPDGNSILIREMNKAFLFDARQHSVHEITSVEDPASEGSGGTQPQCDPAGNWYFELRSGLYQYDHRKKSAREIWRGDLEQAQSFFIDHSGVAWFGNSANGLQTVNLKSLPFRSYTYASGFFADLLRQYGITFAAAKWMHYSRARQYEQDIQTRYDYDTKGNLWIVSGAHAVVADLQKKTFKELPPIEGKDPAFHFTPMTLRKDTCWRVYALTGTPAYYDSHKARWNYPLGEDWKLAAPSNILDIIKSGNTIWAATKHDGLVTIDALTGKTHWFRQDSTAGSLPTNELTDVEQDPTRDSLLWIGTRAGLIRFNILTGKAQTFSVKHGLPNNTVYCIVVDEKGFLWLSTNKGLCRFDPISFEVQNFSGSDGLQGDEFNSFHKLRLPDGHIGFGGTGGFTVFDPLQIGDDTFQPEVQVTKIKINNQEIEFRNGSGELKDPSEEASALNLNYDQNFITVYFAGLQFNNVDKIQYRYRLTGFDNDWNYAGHLGMANYTKIPPGKYVLELNSTNTSGVWSRNVKRVPVTIDPPLWKTTGAYLLYAILFLSTVLGYVRYTVKKIRLENLVTLKNKEAGQLKQLHEFKSRFFTNITHELRTPLTLIISPLEQLLKKNELHERDKKQIILIQQNSHQLLHLINQLLELSKAEAGLMRVSASSINVKKFMEEQIALFEGIARDKKLFLSFQSNLEVQEYFADRDKLESIVNNLLSNAIKFTPAGGSVTASMTKAGSEGEVDLIRLRISDTGTGIPPEALALIFDRFYRHGNDEKNAGQGTGIGLSLVKELTNLLKGTVTVESIVDQGTTFTIMLPMTRDYGAMAPVEDVTAHAESTGGTSAFNGKEEKADAGSKEKPLVLVVEDNHSLRAFLAEQLSDSYRIITACDGKEAWEKTMEEIPELVITDVMMPYVDGITLSRKIRETEDTSHIGLIMLTAKASAESRIDGLQTGVNDYVTKPFSFDELQLRIANLLAHQEKQRAYFRNQLLKDHVHWQPKSGEGAFLDKACQFLDGALADKRNIGVEDLANHFSMSSRTLNRKLSALAGVTANEFIRNYRLSRAATLLQEGLAVSEVAYLVGFESSQYFAQCFKIRYEVTPTEYIHQHRNGSPGLR